MMTVLVNARCYLALVVEMILELRKEMSKHHWEILRGMPFGHLMNVAPMMQERVVLDALLQVYDNHNQHFKIRGSMLPFNTEDVALILDLRCDGDIASFKHERVEFEFK